ncbi:MAG: alpha/beta hydrolase [Chitinophagaceae bacterium]
MKVYFISGLAADRRVFKHIRLPEGYEAVYLDWIDPQPGESLGDYALRLALPIDTTEPFALIGLSMGGMIATEISKRLDSSALVLISSVPLASHLPGYFRIAATLRLHKVVPIGLVKASAKMKRLFTVETNEDKIMLRQIIQDSDNRFIRWAMDAILKWKNDQLPVVYTHIHGTRDEVLPLRFTRPTHIIKKAGHLMVMTNAREVNRIIADTLKKTPA